MSAKFKVKVIHCLIDNKYVNRELAERENR